MHYLLNEKSLINVIVQNLSQFKLTMTSIYDEEEAAKYKKKKKYLDVLLNDRHHSYLENITERINFLKFITPLIPKQLLSCLDC